MGYGLVAINATQLCKNEALTPCKAWELAAKKQFSNVSAQIKSSPKSAFLGLCSEGLIRGIHQGRYSRSVRNRDYAVKAVRILQNEGDVLPSSTTLWNKVMATAEIKVLPNSQMDVVLALWGAGLITSR
ncbi:hypothetical protein HNP12_004436 [Aeromonas hydrophila]|uniref:DUF6979 family protein n=1 Tax=Aeromonas hydrophila TaxID=644 RepID=UPI0021697ABD|nr:hypothetical protein [Aeromonas hydrophila]MCS3770299.1 hypothetical protein [Aeromonas hydrophila]MCS3790724.1 hypothetical protein [Aeromonas hydrophila]